MRKICSFIFTAGITYESCQLKRFGSLFGLKKESKVYIKGHNEGLFLLSSQVFIYYDLCYIILFISKLHLRSFNGCSSIPLKNRKVKKRINKLLNKEMYLITLKKGIGFKKE